MHACQPVVVWHSILDSNIESAPITKPMFGPHVSGMFTIAKLTMLTTIHFARVTPHKGETKYQGATPPCKVGI